MATFKSAKWFEATRGLRNEGADVLRLCKRDVSKEELAEAFGPKSSKNGYRFDYRLTAEAAREVEELYCRVTSKNKITDNEITLQFARGLLVEGKGVQVNWAAFAAHLHDHREKVCSVKAENTDKRQRGEGSTGILLHPPKPSAIRSSVVARSSSSAPISEVGVLPVRSQAEVRMGRGKRSFVKALAPPNWSSVDIEGMKATMEAKEQLCASLKEKVEVLQLEGEKKTSGAQRVGLLLSQHEAIYNAALAEFEKSDVKVDAAKVVLQNLETVLEELMGKKSALLDVGYSGSDIGQFDYDISQKKDALRLASETLKELECQKACERMTERYAYDKLRVSREESDALQECQGLDGKEYRSILVMLKSLESLLPAYENQLLRMEKGGGAILYPQPLSSHPDSPKETISILNPCPVCNFWYECHEHLAASCGHTYHPWCFTEHAKNSQTCLVLDCGEPFDKKCLTTWGIRPYGEHGRMPPSLKLHNMSRGCGEHTYFVLHYLLCSYVYIYFETFLAILTFIPFSSCCACFGVCSRQSLFLLCWLYD